MPQLVVFLSHPEKSDKKTDCKNTVGRTETTCLLLKQYIYFYLPPPFKCGYLRRHPLHIIN